MQYSVVDIEATNGLAGEERIIEIAIFRFDGVKVTDQFISLINPEREIESVVQRLTKITNKMVRTAPKFHEVAKRVLEITDGTILVGHNVGFDSRMLSQEFARLGFYDFKLNQIDTLPISQQLLPNEESHSLGKLCKSLGIPLTGRHRASGDAKATLELFQLLREKDSEKKIIAGSVNAKTNQKKERSIDEKYLHLVESLPNEIGVFYFRNAKNQIIYLEKSKNIKQRVIQHFTGKKKFADQIRRQVKQIDFELTGTMLVASIKELHELKQLRPYHNKYRRPRTIQYYGIFMNESKKEYSKFEIREIQSKRDKPLFWFQSEKEAKEYLFDFTKNHRLCLNVNGLSSAENGCFLYEMDECNGACVNKELVADYNDRINLWKESFKSYSNDFLLVDKGNQTQKYSFIWIKNRQIQGFGFFDYHYQVTETEKRVNRLVEVKDTRQMNFMLFANLQKIQKEKMVELSA